MQYEVAKQWDVIVVGAGPAGATAAAILAAKGKRVLVAEKDRFPRYHIGESLLPYCYFTLERLGMLEALKRSSFVTKRSVQFVSADGLDAHPFYFSNHLDHDCSTTWQVLRSEFDQMLALNAREKGATVVEGVRAKALIENSNSVVGVNLVADDGRTMEVFAPITIDASGRDAFAVNRHHWREADSSLKKTAVWRYFKDSKRDQGIDEGATTIAFLPEKGWLWHIPLQDDLVSVGVVGDHRYLFKETRNLETIFATAINRNEWISDRLMPGRPVSNCRVTADYSFRSRHCARNGLVLAGDALSFIDPIFSSGIFLALKGGELAADAVDAAIEANSYTADRFADYGATICQGIEVMRQLVYAFYDVNFSFGEFVRAHPQLRGDLTDCLVGHLFRDFGSLFTAISASAELPLPLTHGRPLIE